MQNFEIEISEQQYHWFMWIIRIGAGALVLLVIGWLYHKRTGIVKGLREAYQRFFKAKTPTFFKRMMYGALTLIAAPEVVHGLTELINQPDLMPNWIHADWLKTLRYICIGMAFAAKFTVNHRTTPPENIPDVSSPIDVIIETSAPLDQDPYLTATDQP